MKFEVEQYKLSENIKVGHIVTFVLSEYNLYGK